MKTAKAYAAAYFVDCPHCGEGHASSDGSLLWEPQAVASLVVTCFSCGERFKLPRKVATLTREEAK